MTGMESPRGQGEVGRGLVIQSPTHHYGKAPGHDPLNEGCQGRTGSQGTGLEATWAICHLTGGSTTWGDTADGMNTKVKTIKATDCEKAKAQAQ